MDLVYFNHCNHNDANLETDNIIWDPQLDQPNFDGNTVVFNFPLCVKFTVEQLEKFDKGVPTYIGLKNRVVGRIHGDPVEFPTAPFHHVDFNLESLYPTNDEFVYLQTLSPTDIDEYSKLNREERFARFKAMGPRLHNDRQHLCFNLGMVFAEDKQPAVEYGNVIVAINTTGPIEVSHGEESQLIMVVADKEGKLQMVLDVMPIACQGAETKEVNIEHDFKFRAEMKPVPDIFKHVAVEQWASKPIDTKFDLSDLREVLFDAGFMVGSDVDFTSRAAMVNLFRNWNTIMGNMLEYYVDEFFTGVLVSDIGVCSHFFEDVAKRFNETVTDYETFRAVVNSWDDLPLDELLTNHAALIGTFMNLKDFTAEVNSKQDIADIYVAIGKWAKENYPNTISKGGTVEKDAEGKWTYTC